MADDNLNNKDLSFDQIREIIKKLAILGVQRIRLTGGEPLYRKDIIHIVRIASNIFKEFSLFSNLTISNHDILREIITFEPRIFWTTLLDHRPYSHDTLVNKSGSQKLTVASINYLIKHDVDVGVQIPISKYNYSSLYQSLKFIQELGVETIKILPIFPTGRALSNIDKLCVNIAWEQILKICSLQDFALTNYSKIIISTYASKENRESQLPECIGGINKILNIDHKGNVFPCCVLMGNKNFSLFNMLDLNFKEQYKKYSIAGREKNIHNAKSPQTLNSICPVFSRKINNSSVNWNGCPLQYITIKSGEK
ncbi:radical SAM protein [Candidatus Parvarchaeota archaeon]|nr:radical SAM protein [Candidatus Parvarchaeota archaeon]